MKYKISAHPTKDHVVLGFGKESTPHNKVQITSKKSLKSIQKILNKDFFKLEYPDKEFHPRDNVLMLKKQYAKNEKFSIYYLTDYELSVTSQYHISDRDFDILTKLESIDIAILDIYKKMVIDVLDFRGEWERSIKIDNTFVVCEYVFYAKHSMSIYSFKFKNRLGDGIGFYPLQIEFTVNDYVEETEEFIDHYEEVYNKEIEYDKDYNGEVEDITRDLNNLIKFMRKKESFTNNHRKKDSSQDNRKTNHTYRRFVNH